MGAFPCCDRNKKPARELPGGAIAFSRTGDMSSGDFDDAVVLGQFGLVPEECLVKLDSSVLRAVVYVAT